MGGLFSGLIRPNATARVEVLTTTRDAAGGTVEAYSPLGTVPCLVTGVTGARDGRFGGTDNVMTGTVAGDDPLLGRGDCRLFFVTGPAAGRYARVESAEAHGPAAPGSWIDAFYRSRWTQIRTAG